MNDFARKQFVGAVFDYITAGDGSTAFGYMLGYRAALDTSGACTLDEYCAMCDMTDAAITARYSIREMEAR